MSVLLETSLGDVVIDLHTAEAPRTSDNFLKLCAIKAYNDCTLHIRPNYIQTADTPHSSSPPASIPHLIALASHPTSPSTPLPPRFLADEFHPSLSHASAYTVSMLNLGLPHTNAAAFFITTTPNLTSLDATHTVFGRVAEGGDVVDRISAQPVDGEGRPVANIRIRHTTVLDDPFPTPAALLPLIPPSSPPPVHHPYDYESLNPPPSGPTSSPSSLLPLQSPSNPPPTNPHAIVLEMIGDLPSADTAPPDSVLFVCKLNPVTRAEDLELIFARFGRVVECVVVRDGGGRSLCYGFVGFERKEECEAAYVKMDGVVVDDRRIRVDFSQSVAKQWKAYRQGNRQASAGGRGAAAAVTGGAAAGGGARPAAGGSRWGGRVVEDSASRTSRWGERSEGRRGPVHERGEERKQAERREERSEGGGKMGGDERGRGSGEERRSDRRGREERDERESRRKAGDEPQSRRERSRSPERQHRRPHSSERRHRRSRSPSPRRR